MTAVSLPPGYRLDRFDSLDSTMAEAERQATTGAGDGTLIQALRQTAGRGRRGRKWSTPTGNLAFSALLRPKVGLPEAALYGFVAGLALHESLVGYLPDPAALRLKWPNDLLLGGAKLSGMLLESRSGDGGGCDWLVVGIGVNLTWAPDDTPYPATCLAAWLDPVPEAELLIGDWAHAFERWRRRLDGEGFAAVRAGWKAAAAGLGETLTARLADGRELTGRFLDLGDDGNLLLRVAGETSPRAISAGEVFFAGGKAHAAGH